MATMPMFNFRLKPEAAEDLRVMAKLYGAPNTSAFLREMVEAMCSGQPEAARAFIGRLMQKVGEQLTLQLTAPLEVLAEPQKQAKKPRKASKRGKGAGRARKSS